MPRLEFQDFEGFKNVLALRISGVNITDVDVDAFQGLTSLELVHMTDIHLSDDSLTGGLFCGLYNLMINISNINYGEVQENYVLKLISCDSKSSDARMKVSVLELSNSRITFLDSHSFDAVLEEHLISLHLWGNLIKTIHKDTFKRFSNLLSLDISNNELVILEPGLFDSLRGLLSLCIVRNRLTSLNITELHNLDSLISIYANTNSINQLHGRFSSTNALVVGLGDNSLREIQRETFNNCSNMVILDLSQNRIETIEEDAFVHSRLLTHLALGGNQMVDERELLQRIDMSLLRHLNLSSNNFMRLPSAMFPSDELIIKSVNYEYLTIRQTSVAFGEIIDQLNGICVKLNIKYVSADFINVAEQLRKSLSGNMDILPASQRTMLYNIFGYPYIDRPIAEMLIKLKYIINQVAAVVTMFGDMTVPEAGEAFKNFTFRRL